MRNEVIVAVMNGTRGDVIPILLLVKKILIQSPSMPAIVFTPIGYDHLVREIITCNLIITSNRWVTHLINPEGQVVESEKKIDNFFSMKYIINSIHQIIQYKDDISLVICNLFALEAWILSISLRSPCLFLHPCLPQLVSTHSPLSSPRYLGHILKSTYLCAHEKPSFTQLDSNRIENSSDEYLDTFLEWLWPLFFKPFR